MNKTIFKYNLSYYYQSTIVYFAAFILYGVIRGEFVEDSFTLITKDPIIYFFAAVVLISLSALLYNMFKQRKLEISDTEIAFVTRFKKRTFLIQDIKEIKSKRRRGRTSNKFFRIIRIKLMNRRRPVIIRPYDYENEKRLFEMLEELRIKIEEKNV